MPDQKISQLTNATTPLGGSEVAPIVQSGANAKATTQSVSNLGPALSTTSITTTGSVALPFRVALIAPQRVQTPSGDIVAEGIWISALDYYQNLNTGVTSITFDDATGAFADVFSALPANVTSISFPAMKVFANSLGFTGTSLTSVSAPNAVACIGAINIGSGAPSLTSINLPEMQFISSQLSLSGATNLNTVSLPKVKFIGSTITVNACPALTSFSLPLLEGCSGFALSGTNTALASVSFAALTTIGNGSITIGGTNPALTSVNFPALTSLSFGISGVGTSNALTTLDFSALVSMVGNIALSGTAPSLATVSFAALKNVGSIIIEVGASVNYSFPAIETIAPTLTTPDYAIYLANISSFSLGSTLKQVGASSFGEVRSVGSLNQASVDNILVRLAALDGTGGTTAFSNRTVSLGGTNAAPSATGVAAKATLVARGCTVTTN